MSMATGSELLALALVLGAAAGGVAGVKVGGQFMGNGLAAMMGAVFALAAVLPAALCGLIVLSLLR
jgi:hypothetical protein